MIELRSNELVFSFPEVDEHASFSIDFQRTLRIPDDGHEYPLPAGLGSFDLEHVDDHAGSVPATWNEHGGVMMAMHQGEALWLNFHAGRYPFAVKIAAGKINAVTGQEWVTGLTHGPSPSKQVGKREHATAVQDYVVLPEQPWLDGFNVGTGQIRQFVAMPLGGGYTAEEQITGVAEHGGIQMLAYPMKAEAFAKLRERARRAAPYGRPPKLKGSAAPMPDMGLGLGGVMRQDTEASGYGPEVWDLDHPARCFIHLTNAQQWTAITGQQPPTKPPTPAQYRDAGIPWFDYDAPGSKVPGSDVLAELDTVAKIAERQRNPLPDNDPIPIDRIIKLTPKKNRDQVREFN